jgi:hypothetical protein
MKYTAIFIDGVADSGYSTKFFVSSHDKNVAWKDINAQIPIGTRLLFVIPGEQHVYGQADISFTNVA